MCTYTQLTHSHQYVMSPAVTTDHNHLVFFVFVLSFHDLPKTSSASKISQTLNTLSSHSHEDPQNIRSLTLTKTPKSSVLTLLRDLRSLENTTLPHNASRHCPAHVLQHHSIDREQLRHVQRQSEASNNVSSCLRDHG